jgi:tyrosine-protein kinase Etk/Wzc
MEKHEYEILDTISIIVKWRKFIISTFFVCCFLAAIISLLLTPWYTSVTTLLPPEGQGFGGLNLSNLAESIPFNIPMLAGASSQSDLYVAILRSRNVKEGVIKKLNLMQVYESNNIEETLSTLSNNTKIDKSEEGLIIIKATDKSRERAASIAKAYVEELDRVNINLRITSARNTREFVGKRVAETEQRLVEAANNIKEFQEQHKTISLEEQTKAAIEADAEIRSEILSQEVQYNVLRRNFDESHGEVKIIKSRLTELKKQLEKIEMGTGLDKEEFLIPFSELPDLGVKFTFLTRDLEVSKMLYKLLMAQYEQSKIEEAKDTPTIQILDNAVPPIKRSKPKRTIMVLLAGFLSFFISGFSIFTFEYVERLKNNDIERYEKFEYSISSIQNDLRSISRKVGIGRK